MVLAYDAVVDGVFRKASSYVARTVHYQKNKKIDIDKFLYKAGRETVDTDILVAPISGATTIQGKGKETIGTLELRLFVTRQLGVSHTPSGTKSYDEISGNIKDDEKPQPASTLR